jgi:chemotaxis protein methyltransferase CheR
VSLVQITRDEMSAWSRFIQEICGVYLDESKAYLIETRFSELLRETRSANYAELFYKVKSDTSPQMRRKIIDAITTNETSFFRDSVPFDLLRYKLIPELVDRRTKAGMRPYPIRIWSAACSSGQEAYSIAITLKETLGDFNGYDIRILGTDISDRVLAQASYGAFSKLEIERGLPPDKITRFFTPMADRWRVRDELRVLASFRPLNLLTPFSFPAPFDFIFCRNVAIYFTEPDKIKLFRALGRCLAPEGVLFIGSTETLTGICPEFEAQRHLRGVFYTKRRTSP